MKPKIFALYLPQFYETKENNAWWGKGYTDWTAVKKSRPLYDGHYQPQIPLRENFYDLTEVSNIRNQAQTARKYGVDGFCIYHYWSKGQLLMEKPTELLLQNQDIDIEYFLSWANHDFKRTWFDGDGSYLRKQEYGDDEDIRSHYAYLSQFFKDPRYSKIDNCPVLKIFDVRSIPQFERMMAIWTGLAKKDGFDGIYLIAKKCTTGDKSADIQALPYVNAAFIFEPLNVRTNGANESPFYIYKRRAKTWLLRKRNHFAKKSKPELFDYV